MQPTYYAGPRFPRLRLTTWDDVVRQAVDGNLSETRWVELKEKVTDDPTKRAAANLELAKDVASLALAGGLLIFGVADNKGRAGEVVGVDSPDQLRDRIDQVCSGPKIQPALTVDATVVRHPTDPDRGILIVTVSASLTAPHMVDTAFWGRGDTGKRRLTEDEVATAYAQRLHLNAGFRQELLALETDDLNPIPAGERRLSHMFILARPRARITTGDLHTTFLGSPGSMMIPNRASEILTYRSDYSPDLVELMSPHHGQGHSRGVVFDASSRWSASTAPETRERYSAWVSFQDDGAVAMGTAVSDYRKSENNPSGEPVEYVSVGAALEVVHSLLLVTAHVAQSALSYHGSWEIGIRITKLNGLGDARSLDWVSHHPRYRGNDFESSIGTTTREMLDQPGNVLERLMVRLARSFGSEHKHFPYRPGR